VGEVVSKEDLERDKKGADTAETQQSAPRIYLYSF
jgi:hypothetical protein